MRHEHIPSLKYSLSFSGSMFCLLPYTLQGCRCTPPVCGKPSRSKEKALAGTTDRESSAGAFCLDLDAGVRRESSEESEVLTEVFVPPHTGGPHQRRTLPPSHGGDGRAWRGPAESRVRYLTPPRRTSRFSWQSCDLSPPSSAQRRPPMRSRGWPTARASCRWTQPRCPTSRSGADALRATTSQLFSAAEDGVSRESTVKVAVEFLASF